MKKKLLSAGALSAGLLMILSGIPAALRAQAPANNECSGAQALVVETDPYATASIACNTTGATASSNISSCTYQPFPDVWYSFTATHTTHRVRMTNVSSAVAGIISFSYGISAWSGSCGNLTQTACSANNSYNGSGTTLQLNMSGLNVGQTYYIKIWANNVYNSSFVQMQNVLNFNLSVLPPLPPPANDNCINAIDISDGLQVTGSNVASTFSNVAPGTCSFGAEGANDVWYKVTATNDGQIDITNTVFSNEDLILELINGDCTIPSVGDCVNNTFFFGYNQLSFFATAGETYLLRVYGYDGTNTASNFTIKAGGVALPVQLTGLKGTVDAGAIAQLNWETRQEQNNRGFEIERSDDGIIFYRAGYTSSAAPGGNSHEVIHYSFTDPVPLKGTTYFRLKQSDLDGKEVYSKVLALSAPGKGAQGMTAAYGTGTDVLQIRFSAIPSTEARLLLCDLNGRTLQSIQGPAPETILNMSHMAAGVYLLRYYDGGYSEVIRIVRP